MGGKLTMITRRRGERVMAAASRGAAPGGEAVTPELVAGGCEHVLDASVAAQALFAGHNLAEGQAVGECARIRRRGDPRIRDETLGVLCP